MLRGNDTLGTLVIMASIFAMVCHEQARGPEGTHDALDAGLAVPRVVRSHTLAVFELQRRERPSGIDGFQYATGYFGFSLQNFSIMVWPVFLANQRAHGPVAHGYEAGLLIPGIVDQAIAVGGFLPIIDLVAGDACLEDQVRIAPDRVERVILYRTQVIKDARHIRWGKMIGSQKSPGFGA